MKFTSTLIVVKEMYVSKSFQDDVLGLDVVADFGDCRVCGENHFPGDFCLELPRRIV